MFQYILIPHKILSENNKTKSHQKNEEKNPPHSCQNKKVTYFFHYFLSFFL